MKVVYNTCYGGFNLSPLALTMFAGKKGITLVWYEQMYNPCGYRRTSGDPSNSFGSCPFTEDIGEYILDKNVDHKLYYYPYFRSNESRCDPDLVAVVEELGQELSSGSCASLSIDEIPDGREFEIDEYDGNEFIVPPRQDW